MAKFTPVTLYKDGDERVADTARTQVELEYDGWSTRTPDGAAPTKRAGGRRSKPAAPSGDSVPTP